MTDSTVPAIAVYLDQNESKIPELLTPEDRQRLQKINSPKAKKQFIRSHSLLNEVLCTELNTDISLLKLTLNPHGKPYLHPEIFLNHRLFFSLSHCGDHSAVAISHDFELGVDLENTSARDFNSCTKLADRFFSLQEREQLESFHREPVKYQQLFFRIWTLKEAYLKARGTGINIALADISFYLNNDRIKLFGHDSSEITSHVFFSRLIQGHSLAITAACSKSEKLSLEIHSR